MDTIAELRDSASFDWEELLICIEDKRVVPVIGRDVMVLSIDGEDIPFEQYLVWRLAERLGVRADRLGARPDLNAVAMAYLDQGGERRKIYLRLKAIVGEAPLPIPEQLKKLAEIDDFQLYVSLSFDSLLYDALNQVRFHGEPRTGRLIYSTNREVEDLPTRVEALGAPYVYQVFGEVGSTADYAVTDEDVLEFTHSLQSEKHPARLFDELRQRHLLFIGCGFQNWLERFVVRTISNNRLLTRETYGFVADDRVIEDADLTLFLKHYKTEVFLSGRATEFVDTLYDRWRERREKKLKPPPPGLSLPPMASEAVFLSFASADREAVRNMQAALDAAGIDVWFDESDLHPGDAWDNEIKTNIKRCAFFLPFISRHAQARLEGYFRAEWNWAIARSEGIDDSLRFIQPIIIDDIPDNADRIPDYFWTRQAVRFPDGKPTPDFVDALVQAIRNRRLVQDGYAAR